MWHTRFTVAAIKVQRIVFLSLLLDLFAFTVPPPLFSRIIEWYTIVSRALNIFMVADEVLNDSQRESAHPNGFLTRAPSFVSPLEDPGEEPAEVGYCIVR